MMTKQEGAFFSESALLFETPAWCYSRSRMKGYTEPQA